MTITTQIILQNGEPCTVSAEVHGGDFDSVEPLARDILLNRIEQWDAEEAVRREIEG